MLLDGNMEFAGPNRVAWDLWRFVAGGDAVLTEPSSGVFRVAYDGTANPYAQLADAFVVDTYHRIRGSARSDGAAVPVILDGLGETLWTGTDSTDWQSFDVFVEATDDAISLVAAGSSGYVEWDTVEVYDAVAAAGYWTPQTSATGLRKDGTAHSGTQCLLLEPDGTGTNAAYQDLGLTPGKHYNITGAFAGDGSASAYVYAGGQTVAVSTSSTSWQEFDKDFAVSPGGVTSPLVVLICSNPASGRSARFDSITVTEIFPDSPTRDRLFRTFDHLFPRARAWVLDRARTLGQWVYGLTGWAEDAQNFLDLAWTNLDPQQTDELDAWEKQFQIPSAPALTEQARRDRLEARWSQQGGQTLEYLQDQIHGAGFTDVYLHEWMVPETDPVETRNPVQFVEGAFWDCGDPGVECGEPGVECGLKTAGGYLLVNKIRYWDGAAWAWEEYTVNPSADLWSYHLYVCGETFGDAAEVPTARRDEFEDLLLTICPAQHWLALRVDYV